MTSSPQAVVAGVTLADEKDEALQRVRNEVCKDRPEEESLASEEVTTPPPSTLVRLGSPWQSGNLVAPLPSARPHGQHRSSRRVPPARRTTPSPLKPVDFGPPTLCFPSRRSCRWTSTILAALFVCIVMIILVWPRIPSIELSGLAPPTVIVSGRLDQASSATPFVVRFDTSLNLTLYGKGPLPQYIDQVEVQGNLLDMRGPLNATLLYGRVGGVWVPRSGEGATRVSVPLTVLYATVSATALREGDQALILFDGLCQNGAIGMVEVQYVVTLAVSPVFRWKPQWQGSGQFRCPAFELGAVQWPGGP
ncbi:hypothetical protein BC830DRAFT_1089342 [Chytriomyces sp. MP71]|nr:hypothetical protein BC830DRAFT_1089342 [Chytriomyces sp. MP71]